MSYTDKKRENGKVKIRQPSSLALASLVRTPPGRNRDKSTWSSFRPVKTFGMVPAGEEVFRPQVRPRPKRFSNKN